MSFVNNNKPICFSAKLRFAFFWKLHDVFEKFVDEENVFGICDEFELIWNGFLEMLVNSSILNSPVRS